MRIRPPRQYQRTQPIPPKPFQFKVSDRVSLALLGKTFTAIVIERYSFGDKNFYTLESDRPGFTINFRSQAEENITLLDEEATARSHNAKAWITAFNQL